MEDFRVELKFKKSHSHLGGRGLQVYRTSVFTAQVKNYKEQF